MEASIIRKLFHESNAVSYNVFCTVRDIWLQQTEATQSARSGTYRRNAPFDVYISQLKQKRS